MSILKQLGLVVTVAFVLSAGGLARADQLDVADGDGVHAYGPGEGGGDGGFNCYFVHKELYKNSVLEEGHKALYKIHVKALCNLPKPRLFDKLPHGVKALAASSGCMVLPGGDKVACSGNNAKAGEEAVVYMLVQVGPPAKRWAFNNACFSDAVLGGYACHGIWSWVRPCAPTSSPTDPVRDEPELPADGGFLGGGSA
jgi:hypothetical protein